MPNHHVTAALKADSWSLIERRLESGPAMLRFRTPEKLLGPASGAE
jgi:hypothetical protein